MNRATVLLRQYVIENPNLYWLRFGYFIGADSGSGLHQHDAPKPGAMHQRPTN